MSTGFFESRNSSLESWVAFASSSWFFATVSVLALDSLFQNFSTNYIFSRSMQNIISGAFFSRASQLLPPVLKTERASSRALSVSYSSFGIQLLSSVASSLFFIGVLKKVIISGPWFSEFPTFFFQLDSQKFIVIYEFLAKIYHFSLILSKSFAYALCCLI